MTSTTNVLITGAGRGIGKGLLEHYLGKPNHTVIAALRDIQGSNARALLDLPAGDGSKVILVRIEATSTTDPFQAAKDLEAQGIDKVDVIIANAGIVGQQGPLESIDPGTVANVYLVNSVGPSLLFMGLWPLLMRSENPKWLSMSSNVGSIADYEKNKFFKMFPYNASKAALNHFTMTIHVEYEKLVAFAVSPGFVETDMARDAVRAYGLENPTFSDLGQVADSIIELIDHATKENTSGRFIETDGRTIPW